MSDNKLRELERIWQHTGTAGDEASYLLEAVRAGEVHIEQLRLAACLRPGSEAARIALRGDRVPQCRFFWDLARGLTEWFETEFAQDAAIRLLLGMTLVVFPVWEEWAGERAELGVSYIAAMKRYLRSSSDRQLWSQLPSFREEFASELRSHRPGQIAQATMAIWLTSRLIDLVVGTRAGVDSHWSASDRWASTFMAGISAVLPAHDELLMPAPFAVANRVLLPWALGRGDPILETEGPALSVEFTREDYADPDG